MLAAQSMKLFRGALALLLLGATFAHGQGSPDARAQALTQLADFAERICTAVPLKGSTNNLELSGGLNIELRKLLRNLASVGIESAAKYQNADYEGVLQEDLASALAANQNCKLTIVMGLKERLLPVAAPPKRLEGQSASAPTREFATRYIDTAVTVLPDKPGIAVHLIGLPGQDITGIADAAQSALRDEGYNVMPLFKRRFSQDRRDLEAYDGSASLMKQLGADKYCDNLLLGRMRVTRAPTLAGGGVFIAEVTLTMRAVSTRTGQIVDELAVAEKGAGADAQASIADSLRRLEFKVKDQLAGWTR